MNSNCLLVVEDDPGIAGLEVLKFLRQQFSRARIVIVSGSDGSSRRMTENLGKALGFTMEANLSKPFQIPEFRAVLEKIKLSLDETKKSCGYGYGNRN